MRMVASSRSRARVVVALAALAMTACQSPARGGNPALTAALLGEDWAAVVAQLNQAELPVESRAIKAHALLALNRNNESVCLFSSLARDDDRRLWRAWTEAFVAQHPRAAVAHYLMADALARLGELDAAIQAMDRALGLKPDHPLALNARGAILALQEKWDQALADFDTAIKRSPRFADAYASRGTMWLQRRSGDAGALRAFERALELSPDFVLALNGRVSVAAAQARWADVDRDLRLAREKVSCAAEVIAENVVRIVEHMNGDLARRLTAQASGADAGMTLEKSIQALRQNPSQGSLNALIGTLRNNPQESQRAMTMLADETARNPTWGQQILALSREGARWNNGPAQQLTGILGGLHADLKTTGGGVTAGAGIDLGRWATSQDAITEKNRALFQGAERAISQALPDRAAAGVEANVSAAHIDIGEWPFELHYGLLYRSTSGRGSGAAKGSQ